MYLINIDSEHRGVIIFLECKTRINKAEIISKINLMKCFIGAKVLVFRGFKFYLLVYV